MSRLILGEHPQELVVRLTESDPAVLVAVLVDGAGTEIDWPAAPVLEFGYSSNSDVALSSFVAVTDGATATWTLTTGDVDTLVEYRVHARVVRCRIQSMGIIVNAGKVSWNNGWAGTNDHPQRLMVLVSGNLLAQLILARDEAVAAAAAAAASALEAAQSEAAAAASALEAAQSEAAAHADALAAAASAADASGSAADAHTDALAATAAALDAAQAEANAAQSALAAAQSEAAAAASAVAAANSQTAAAGSAGAAAGSAGAAAGSATAASGSAASAAQSAADAHTDALAAAQSKVDAAASALAAANSQAAAAASALAAANSAAAAAGVATSTFTTIITQQIKNPIFQTDTSQWNSIAGTLNRTGVGAATFTVTAVAGNTSILLPASTPTASRVPITPGKYQHVGMWMTALRDLDISTTVQFCDTAGGSTGTVSTGTQRVLSGQTVWVGAVDALAPALTTGMYARIFVKDAASGTAALGDALTVKAGVAYVTDTPIGWTVLDLPLLYGGMPGVRWTGTAHASTSEVYAPPVALLQALTRFLGPPYVGIGSPEGVITANPGVEYTDMTDSTNPVKWTKRTGQGTTTGWAPTLVTILTNLARNPNLVGSTTHWNTNNLTGNLAGSGNWRMTGQGTAGIVYLGIVGSGATQMNASPGQYAHAVVQITAVRDIDVTPRALCLNNASAVMGTKVGPKVRLLAGQTAVIGTTDMLVPAGTTFFYGYFGVTDATASTLSALESFVVNGGAAYVTTVPMDWAPADVPILSGASVGGRWTGTANQSTSEVYAPPATLINALGKGQKRNVRDPVESPNAWRDWGNPVWSAANGANSHTGAIQIPFEIGNGGNTMLSAEVEFTVYGGGGPQKGTIKASCYYQAAAATIVVGPASIEMDGQGSIMNTPSGAVPPVVRWIRAPGANSGRLWLTIGNVTDVWPVSNVAVKRVVSTYGQDSLISVGTPTWVTTLPTGDTSGSPQVRDKNGIYWGVGSPEGVFSAVVGTEYVDSTAAGGAVKWIKGTGTSNTGWVVQARTSSLPDFTGVDPVPAYGDWFDSARAFKDLKRKRWPVTAASGVKTGAIQFLITLSGTTMLDAEVALNLYTNGIVQKMTIESGLYFRTTGGGVLLGGTGRVQMHTERATFKQGGTPIIPRVRWLRVSDTQLALIIGEVTDTWSNMAPVMERLIVHSGAAVTTDVSAATWITTLPTADSTVEAVLLDGSGVYTGTGSPEGVVSADVSAEYVDRARTLGVGKWIKVTGTGTTGWVPVDGDTGWINLTPGAQWTTSTAGGMYRIRRRGAEVFFNARIEVPVGSAYIGLSRSTSRNDLLTLSSAPVGFRKGYYSVYGTIKRSGLEVPGFVSNTGSINRADWIIPTDTGTIVAGDIYFAEARWTTDEAWPIALPTASG